MKKTLFRVIYPALILAALLTAACGTVFEEPATDPAPAAGKGIARIDIAGRTAAGRTLQPDHLALYYALEFTKGEETVRSFINNDTAVDVELDSGTWGLDVKGYLSEEDFEADPDYPAITGAANGPVAISDGQVTPVTVILTAAQTKDGIGWISFDLSFPDTVDLAVLDIKPLLGAPTTLYQPVNLLDTAYATDNEDGTLRSAGQVDENFGAGFYRLDYTLFIGSGTLPRKVVRTMVVHIYDGLVSTLVAEYALENFTEFRSFASLTDLSAYLASQPANTKDTPYEVVLEGLEFKDSTLGDNPFAYSFDKLGALYNAFQGKYVTLDLSGCSGDIPDTTGDNANSRGASRRLIISLILPDSMSAIGDYAFSGCGNMVSVDLPGDLTTLGDYAFYSCSVLASVDFEESPLLQSLGRSSFYETGITSLVLPASVSFIDGEVFYGCNRLLSADLSACQFTTFGGYGTFRECTSLKTVLLPAGLTAIPDQCFVRTALGPTLDLSSFTELTAIGENAFRESTSLETVIFPASLTTMSHQVFWSAKALATVDFSACTALSSIGYETFLGCANLSSVDLSATAITSLSNNFFNGCTTLKSVTLPAGLTSIDTNAFEKCRALTSIALPAGLTSIGTYAFSSSGLSGTLDLSALTSLTTIGASAFANCTALTAIALPPGLTSIGNRAFENSGLSGTLDLSALTSLTTIGSGNTFTFQNCTALTSVILPASFTTIGGSTFLGCTGLVWVKWPVSGANATVSPSAFSGCAGLTKVELPNNLRTASSAAIAANAFKDCDALQVLIIRTGASGSGNSDAWPALGDTSSSIPQNTGLKIYVPAAGESYFKATVGASLRFGWSGYAAFIHPDTAIASDGNDPSAW
ncbi:MAG: leucine-rich repeat domain-containing protein [Treponema sp.]|jgi:hypothetical protein|nr:leucine-rich repeat domain-containing protein [Treponema sp.]